MTTNPEKPARPCLAAGTRILNTDDGEPGTVLNGYAWSGAECLEYEVETHFGIEIWHRDRFALMSDLEAAVREAR